jgi:hypothetical protein
VNTVLRENGNSRVAFFVQFKVRIFTEKRKKTGKSYSPQNFICIFAHSMGVCKVGMRFPQKQKSVWQSKQHLRI